LKANVAQLGKIGNGSTYAYLKMNLAVILNKTKLKEKEIEKLYDTIGSYKHLRYLDVSSNKITDLSSVKSLQYLVSLNASRNEITSL